MQCWIRQDDHESEGHRGDARVQRGTHDREDVPGSDGPAGRRPDRRRGRRESGRDGVARPHVRQGGRARAPAQHGLRRQPENLLPAGPRARGGHRRDGPRRLPIHAEADPGDGGARGERPVLVRAGIAHSRRTGAEGRHAGLALRRQPRPDARGQPAARHEAVGVPHRLPRVLARAARAAAARRQLGRLRLRQRGPRRDDLAGIRDRRSLLPRPLHARSLVDQFSAQRALRLWLPGHCAGVSPCQLRLVRSRRFAVVQAQRPRKTRSQQRSMPRGTAANRRPAGARQEAEASNGGASDRRCRRVARAARGAPRGVGGARAGGRRSAAGRRRPARARRGRVRLRGPADPPGDPALPARLQHEVPRDVLRLQPDPRAARTDAVGDSRRAAARERGDRSAPVLHRAQAARRVCRRH